MALLSDDDLKYLGFNESKEKPGLWLNKDKHIQFEGKDKNKFHFDLKGELIIDLVNKIRTKNGEPPIANSKMPKNPFL